MRAPEGLPSRVRVPSGGLQEAGALANAPGRSFLGQDHRRRRESLMMAYLRLAHFFVLPDLTNPGE